MSFCRAVGWQASHQSHFGINHGGRSRHPHGLARQGALRHPGRCMPNTASDCQVRERETADPGCQSMMRLPPPHCGCTGCTSRKPPYFQQQDPQGWLGFWVHRVQHPDFRSRPCHHHCQFSSILFMFCSNLAKDDIRGNGQDVHKRACQFSNKREMFTRIFGLAADEARQLAEMVNQIGKLAGFT